MRFFLHPMPEVETLLAEKYASGQPPGPPPRIHSQWNKTGGNRELPWRNVHAMKREKKVEVQAILDRLSARYGLGRLALAKDNRCYVAMQEGGVKHPLIDIVTKNHRGVVVLYCEEEVGL